jgi:hypothetical protein
MPDRAPSDRRQRRAGKFALLIAAIMAGGGAAGAFGQATANDPFSLRLPAALDRFSSYADVAAVGDASAGSKWCSSANPASVGWLDLAGQSPVSVSPQYSSIAFDEGMRINVTTEAGMIDLGPWGRLQPALAQAWSNHATTRQGLGFDFDLQRYQMNWGKRFGDDSALGAGFQYTTSQVQYDLGGTDLSRSRSDAYGWRVGGLQRIDGPLLAGVVAEYSFSRDRTMMFGIPAFGIPETHVEDTTHQLTLRPGLSYEYQKDSQILLDYEFGSFFNHDGGIQVNRFFGGVDHRIVDWLFVRGGVALDTGGNPAWTCGVGIYPCKAFTIDLAYQQDMFPEIRPEFGRSRTLTLSLGFSF